MGLLNLDQNTLALVWNETGDHLLSYILGRVIEELLELEARESMNDFIFAFDSDRVLRLELIQATLLLEHILNQAASSVCHFA